ncbi:MAG: GPW/gp25 family protein, partial [Anaerolineae bacterium]
DGRGGIALAFDADKIAQAVWIILSTPMGQRVMRPTFGSRMHELLFRPANPETLGLAELYVKEALEFWEPRIELQSVHAAVDPDQHNVILIHVQYLIKATHDERSLVYPFYQIPGE